MDFFPIGTLAGQVCKLMKLEGLSDVSPSHQTLRTLLEAGATEAEFQAAARTAVKAQAGFGYALSVVANERKRAAELAGQIHRGALPSKQESLEQRNRAAGQAWLASQGVTA